MIAAISWKEKFMLTSLSWVPHGRMRSVPLRVGAEADAVMKARLRQHAAEPGDDDAAFQSDEDVHNVQDDDDLFGIGEGGILEQIESDDESEIDDITFRDTDLVFAAVRADKDDEPSLELYVYDEPSDNLYLHHDAALSAFPLCTSWLTEGTTSLLAIGTMLPYIEIWNLDMIDAFEPMAVLGGCVNSDDNFAPHKKRKRLPLVEGSHTDAVVCVRWNTNAAHVLGSGGADSKLKLWDLNQQTCVSTFDEAEGARVQTLDWHHTEANRLLVGVGGGLAIRDCRQVNETIQWNSEGDTIECARWCFHDPYVYASTSGGSLVAFDERKGSGSAPLWHIVAHDGELTFDVSRHSPLLATGGKDAKTSLWSLTSQAEPQQLASRKLGVGQAFSIQFHPNSADVVAAVGSRGQPLVYTITGDIRTNAAAVATKEETVPPVVKSKKWRKKR